MQFIKSNPTQKVNASTCAFHRWVNTNRLSKQPKGFTEAKQGAKPKI